MGLLDLPRETIAHVDNIIFLGYLLAFLLIVVALLLDRVLAVWFETGRDGRVVVVGERCAVCGAEGEKE
jgi:hypothetical protein